MLNYATVLRCQCRNARPKDAELESLKDPDQDFEGIP